MSSTVVSAMHDRKPGQVRARPSRGRATPFKLVVVATDTADTVSAAGGFIFDSVRAGWIVEVYLETPGDERALQILGVRSQALPDAFEFECEWPDTVILAAALPDRHRGVQRLLAGSIRRHLTDVAVWGPDVPSDLDTGMEYRLSTAARAFKPHAMSAAGLPPRVTTFEPFRGGRRRLSDAAPSRLR